MLVLLLSAYCYVVAAAAVGVAGAVAVGADKQTNQHKQNNNNNKKTRYENTKHSIRAVVCLFACSLLCSGVAFCLLPCVYVFVLRVVVAAVVGTSTKQSNTKAKTNSNHATCVLVA